MNAAKRPDEILELMLVRSAELHDALLEQLGQGPFDSSERGEGALRTCAVSLEHACGLRLLVADGYYVSAKGVLRLQFESLTRAMWLLYIASDAAVTKLIAPLTPANEQAARNLPSVNEMVKQIRGGVGGKVPAAAAQMLEGFKDNSWSALNSFVHAGIHSVRRHAEGYSLPLVLDVLRNSNALSTMAGMTLAILTGDGRIARSMPRIQLQFADCLPDLHPAAD
jgi:hypothetical protein